MPGRRSALPLTVTAVTRGVASEQDGKEHMIGCQWIVCHRHSGGESAGIPAAGLADKPDMATSAVEMIVDEADRVAWGLMVRIAMDPWASGRTSRVPHGAGMRAGRHASDGCFHWWPLHPCEWGGEDAPIMADLAGELR